MTHRYSLFLFIIVLYSVHFSTALGFEGNITLVKQTCYDTAYYSYTVKGNWVRIDEKNAQAQVMQSLIIDVRNKTVTALSPSQKLYTTVTEINDEAPVQKDFSIIKTDSYKYIDGYRCYLWRLRNTNLNIEVSFWVVESDFSFFNDVVSILSHTEDYARFCLYFDRIPQNKGFFPMLTVEKTLLRDEKMKVIVHHIVRKKVDTRLFQVPREYKYLRF
jgi:hypothetical protein